MRRAIGTLLLILTFVASTPVLPALQIDPTPTIEVTEVPVGGPDIGEVIDDTTIETKFLLDQAADFLLLISFGILAVLKWVFPSTQVTTETLYKWVVGAATAIFSLVLILGYQKEVTAFLLYIAEPSKLLLDFLKVLLGPAGVYTIAKVLRVPFLGDKQGVRPFSVQRVPESNLISAVSASLGGPKG